MSILWCSICVLILKYIYIHIIYMVLLVPFQSKYISVFHPVSPGLHMETPGKVDGDHLHAESNPGDGRNLMADFNQERGEKM